MLYCIWRTISTISKEGRKIDNEPKITSNLEFVNHSFSKYLLSTCLLGDVLFEVLLYNAGPNKQNSYHFKSEGCLLAFDQLSVFSSRPVGLKIACFKVLKEARGFSLPLLQISFQKALEGAIFVHKKILIA